MHLVEYSTYRPARLCHRSRWKTFATFRTLAGRDRDDVRPMRRCAAAPTNELIRRAAVSCHDVSAPRPIGSYAENHRDCGIPSSQGRAAARAMPEGKVVLIYTITNSTGFPHGVSIRPNPDPLSPFIASKPGLALFTVSRGVLFFAMEGAEARAFLYRYFPLSVVWMEVCGHGGRSCPDLLLAGQRTTSAGSFVALGCWSMCHVLPSANT